MILNSYKFSATLIKVSSDTFFLELDKLIKKFIWKNKQLRRTKKYLERTVM